MNQAVCKVGARTLSMFGGLFLVVAGLCAAGGILFGLGFIVYQTWALLGLPDLTSMKPLVNAIIAFCLGTIAFLYAWTIGQESGMYKYFYTKCDNFWHPKEESIEMESTLLNDEEEELECYPDCPSEMDPDNDCTCDDRDKE